MDFAGQEQDGTVYFRDTEKPALQAKSGDSTTELLGAAFGRNQKVIEFALQKRAL
jgi:hypothetical protein